MNLSTVPYAINNFLVLSIFGLLRTLRQIFYHKIGKQYYIENNAIISFTLLYDIGIEYAIFPYIKPLRTQIYKKFTFDCS